MHKNNNNEIVTLFTYRYLLNEPQPPHDFKQDIEDLRVFPERLEISHVDEWRSYIRRYINRKKLSDAELETLTKRLDIPEISEEFQYLKSILITALKINDSPEIKVINTPLKAYLNKLIKM
ncbi:hypothetical protein C6Y40_21125 [Alteromonas alba]|uniref:Uncharacterized protein n=1 Tax=Alteromonas alba TaxID=2079529 RepID=A0A2S9V5F0_9ALTE|nr:hypothetical protein [Alteromonas alba]PRO71634.1 hypothetical protein C6Y40_21125 [Alteromonas alba]